jgi:iron complex transport system substrate-binding protein
MSQNHPMPRAVLLFFLAIYFVSGCHPGQEEIHFATRPKQIHTVASLSPSTTEIVGSMTFNLKLVGRSAADNFPPNVNAKGTEVPIVAGVKPDYEKLKAANPDLVVYDADLYSDQDIAQIKALGAETFGFKAKTLMDFQAELLAYGGLVGGESEASTYADKIWDEAKAAEADSITPRPKVAVIMPGLAGQHYILGTKSFEADVVKAAGGDIVGPDSDKYVPMNAERLMQLNPDMIITAGKPDQLIQDPQLKSLKAIAGMKVRGIDQDVMTRRGYRVDRNIRLVHQSLLNMAQGTK